MVSEEVLEQGARSVVDDCMDVGPGDTVLVLNDREDDRFAKALMDAARRRAMLVAMKEFEPTGGNGVEPPRDVTSAMTDFDVVLMPTKYSLTHTDARRKACDSGARVASMPGIGEEGWKVLAADYSRVAEISEKVYGMLEETDRVRVETPSGTELEFSINVDYFHTDTGLIDEPGEFGNLPAGEADGGVTDVNGTLVIDHFPFAPSGTEVEIEGNRAVSISDESCELAEAFEDDCVRQLAEFGFGTNPEASIIGSVLVDEKVLGTVHFAFGDNGSYIGSGEHHNPCSVHWDSVCESPTVWFDGEKVLDQGEPVFLEE